MNSTDTLYVIESDTVTAVPRLPQSQKAYKEAWVRDLIHRHPDLLPVSEVLPDAGTFVPIGIEIALENAGKVDVLGVTSGGYPVVVETKLWKNPQARREVLSQTIDYVKEIAQRGYEWLDELWRNANPSATSLYEGATALDDGELDETEFIDRIDRACRSGNVIGFIVGDGIRYGLAEMIAHLGRESSHLRYSLQLLELKSFELPSGGLAVLPTLVRDIRPVERAYVRIETSSALADQIQVTSTTRPERSTSKSGSPRKTLTEDEYWSKMDLAVGPALTKEVRGFVDGIADTAELELDYKQSALMLKVPDPEESAESASVFAITSDGAAYNTWHGRRLAVKQWRLSEPRVNDLFGEYFRRLNAECADFKLDGIHHAKKSEFVPLSVCAQHFPAIGQAIEWVSAELRSMRMDEEEDRSRIEAQPR